MRIKRFEAPDSKTALALVKKELGDNAVILANKTLDAGTPNQRYEVLAAMDYDIETLSVPALSPEQPKKRDKKPAIYGYDAFRKNQTQTTAPTSSHRDEDAISFEAHDMRMRFSSLLRKNGAAPPVKQKSEPSQDAKTKCRSSRPNRDEIARWRDRLIDRIQVCPPEIERSGQPTILALVGPTGVGKTTTSAKIAAWYKLRRNCRVTMLSMDCYRIGATDQLRTYARIMQLPCEVALRRKDLTRALHRHRDSDLIIIDTAGKSPYDTKHIDELSLWFSSIGHLQPQLVLSATTKKEDLKEIIDVYAPLGPTGLILTKLDETRAYATLCQQVAGAEIPISYLATGQKVPEDFIVGSKSFLEKLFKNGWSAVAETEHTLSAHYPVPGQL
ncbi:MAG: flagellar biosynthesis protein FlhF [Desulfobulbaceae bacterium]|nr:flagellar biosynthesis protein FlhF [Desulfobulbaceae bacterium]